MSRSTLLAQARIPDTRKSLLLYEHKDKFSIVIPGRGELMNSRVHGSERALADLAVERLAKRDAPRILVGGPAGHPLDDPGSTVYQGDVARLKLPQSSASGFRPNRCLRTRCRLDAAFARLAR